jgi:outer membrane biosynthesis protein TonB
MLGSLALHGGVAALLMLSFQWNRDLKVGAVVPVTLVSNAPSTDLRPAVQAPEAQTALTDEPVPDAPLEATAPAPEPQPQPQPPAPAPAAKAAPPTPAPKAAAKPAPKQPAATQAPAPKAEKGLDFAALEASLSKMTRPAGARPSSAAKGPARPETATQARPALGTGSAAAALSGLTDELQRRWNPNCDVEGGRDVQVRVTFTLGAGGQVVGDVAAQIRGAQTAVSQAAADRATRAVYAASPFRNLPREFYGDRIAVNFNAREACS